MEKLKGVLGVTNKTEDNKFIPFLDFDNIEYDHLVMELHTIQRTFKLSWAFIIESTHGFNVFFLDKLTFDTCLEICKSCRFIDYQFTKYAVLKDNFTLRIGKDKHFIGSLMSTNYDNELSFAHYNFFNEFFHIDLLSGFQITDYKFDKFEEIQLVLFMSKKYGYIEVD